MGTIYEKECPICGKFFTTTSNRQKYCDDCKVNPERAKRKLEKALNISKKRTWKDYVETYQCEVCGKNITAPPKLVVKIRELDSADHKEHVFCSKKHKYEYLKAHSTCARCGKSLKDNDFYNPEKDLIPYCSKECKEEHELAIARSTGKIKVCQHCGKEFVSPSAKYFCSRECWLAARASGWVSPEKLKKEKESMEFKGTVAKKAVCAVCGKVKTIRVLQKDAAKLWFCSKECLMEGKKRLGEKKKEVEIEKKKLKKERGEINQNVQLCADCRTNYNDCERMKSNFRILPKGARCNNKGQVISCPKYK